MPVAADDSNSTAALRFFVRRFRPQVSAGQESRPARFHMNGPRTNFCLLIAALFVVLAQALAPLAAIQAESQAGTRLNAQAETYPSADVNSPAGLAVQPAIVAAVEQEPGNVPFALKLRCCRLAVQPAGACELPVAFAPRAPRCAQILNCVWRC